jgi:hypothetical protein
MFAVAAAARLGKTMTLVMAPQKAPMPPISAAVVVFRRYGQHLDRARRRVPAADRNRGMVVRLLLVHSPLVGLGTWNLVAADLAGRGWEVGVPDLTGTLTAGPPYCARQAGAIARSASGQPAILVGHSGAGPLLAGQLHP